MYKVNKLLFKNIGINTLQEHTVYMRSDCHVCKSEGFAALTRVRVSFGSQSIIASLNIIESGLLAHDELSLSTGAMKILQVKDGAWLSVSHLSPVTSMKFVRSKIYGKELDEKAYTEIIHDIVEGNYSNIDIAAFVSGCAGGMRVEETICLTKAMIHVGEQIAWNTPFIVDKHSVGGLPGNRTTPIVVSIIAAAGLTIPKTSSRAITSPAGTADTMETITRVALTIEEIKNVVEQEGGCFAWGGSVKLSPADDVLIRVERALDIDSEGQMIASVLSKKIAAGCSHVVIDIPVGETAKVRSNQAAEKLKASMEAVGAAIGLKLKVLINDGSQPIGKGIGPSLEAMDVLSVLQNKSSAPKDLKERALLLAGALLELAEKAPEGQGIKLAREILESGKAMHKFMAICKAQGGFNKPKFAKYFYAVKSTKAGKVVKIDNRRLAKIAKLAGAPDDPSAGILFNAPLGKICGKGDILYTIYAESEGELAYALEYVNRETLIVQISETFQ